MTLPVEYPEGLPDLLLDVSILVNVFGHQVDKFVEADATIAILVDFVDHFLKELETTVVRSVVKNNSSV